MIKILATLPNGKKVFHGELDRGIFRRIVPRHHVRFSEHSFCLNTSVIAELLRRNCRELEFLFVKKTVKELYSIGFEEAINAYRPSRNEYGEENLRIPIQDCYLLIRKELTQPREPLRIFHEPAPIQKQESLQTTLF